MAARSCVIVVENLPVPFDRRVWQEAQALVKAGWKVSIICPRTEAYPAERETIETIEIYRHALPLEARGKLAYVLEYSAALFHEFRLLWRVRREQGFSVIQACNPPDIICLAALPFTLFGAKFVYDQHDLSPELYSTKFGRRDFIHKVLLALERLSYRMANLVVTANESYRQLAIHRGGKHPDDVVAVYSIPSRGRIYRDKPLPELRQGVRMVLGYVGIIGDQDGVDHLVRTVHALVKLGAKDFRAVVVGDGPALASVRSLATELEIDDFIVFTGYRSGSELIGCISAFDIGIIPDPVNEANDLMSMNKVFEYSALGIPAVAYRLTETVRLLGDAGTFAETNDPEGLAKACLTLMNNDDLRHEAASRALRLSQENFIWEHEAAKYVQVYERIINADASGRNAATALPVSYGIDPAAGPKTTEGG